MLKRFAQLYDVIESTVGEHETTQFLSAAPQPC